MVQIARDKSGRLVIGLNLKRHQIYKSKQELKDTPYGVRECWVIDEAKPLEPKEWIGSKMVFPKNEEYFSEKIKSLTWDNEPINL